MSYAGGMLVTSMVISLIAVIIILNPLLYFATSGDDCIMTLSAVEEDGSDKFFTYLVNWTRNDNDAPRDSVTINTHCTTNNLHYIPALVERWNGPVSIVVITTVPEFNATLEATRDMVFCFPLVRRHVVLLITTASEHKAEGTVSAGTSIPCNHLEEHLLDRFQGKNFAIEGIPYPANFLRNLGRRVVSTDFHLTLDIDMLPSAGLYSQTAQLLRTWKDKTQLLKTAIVLPTFEAEEHWPIPATKDELLSAFEQKYVRSFYVQMCPHCQLHHDLHRWLSIRGDSKPIDVAFYKRYHPLWEPYVITHTSAPFHDETFVQYGYNRAIQICELHVSEFAFAVLDEGFLVHQGFKRPTSFHANKNIENARNQGFFRERLEFLKRKYPDSKNTCV